MYKLAKFAYSKARGSSDSSPKPELPKRPCHHQWRPLSETSAGEAKEPERIQAKASQVHDQSHSSSEPPRGDAQCAICQKQKRDLRVYRWKLIAGLFLPDILSTLDLTIVATASPFIASHFQKFDQLNWIVTAFTLTSTALIPAFGQLADVFGRHAVLQLAMFLMLVGSILCAAAQTWAMLLLGRALQGTSSAGIMNIVMIILADKVPLKENAKNTSIFTFIAGTGYAVGPVIGGYLTDANWRYCFLLPIPMAFVSHIVIYVLLRHDLVEGTHFKRGSRLSSLLPALGTIDIIGTILFIFGVGLIILGTSWGGSTYPWSSSQVLAPLIVGGICIVMFFVYEYLLEPSRFFGRLFSKQTPMLPFSIFRMLDTLWLAVLQFAAGAALYSIFYFVGIYFTLVEAYPASKAGVQLLYYIPGMGAGAYLAVYLCNVRPAQTFLPLSFGTLAETIGLALVTFAISKQDISLINGMMVLTGAGTGARFMPATLHVAGVWPERLAPAMSLMRFAMPFGGTLGLTIMGSVFSNKMAASLLASTADADRIDVGNPQSLAYIAGLPPAEQTVVRMAGKSAVKWAFIAIMPIMGICLVTGLFLGNVWVRKSVKGNDEEKDVDAGQDEDGVSEVIDVPYLWALFKGNMDSYKRISKPLAADGQHQPSAGIELQSTSDR